MDKTVVKTTLIKAGLIVIGLAVGKQLAVFIKRQFPNVKIAA